LHGHLGYYLLANGVMLVVFLLLMLVMRRKNEFHPRMFVPVLIESAIYAVTMGSLIVFVMQNVLHVDPRLAVGPEAVGPFGKVVLSFGAGVHEELVFRLMMIPGFAALGEKVLKLRRWVATGFAFLASAILFSAAHHVIGGEPWRLGVFTYRVLCGLIFAVIFQTRGFAVAVYTHALYDVFVLLVQS
jgi:membrane protease YdiL (CAAX protease family)